MGRKRTWKNQSMSGIDVVFEQLARVKCIRPQGQCRLTFSGHLLQLIVVDAVAQLPQLGSVLVDVLRNGVQVLVLNSLCLLDGGIRSSKVRFDLVVLLCQLVHLLGFLFWLVIRLHLGSDRKRVCDGSLGCRINLSLDYHRVHP